MWFKVDDGFHSHSKALASSPAALGLWVVAGSWCGSKLTDGFVPDHVLPRLLDGSGPLADELVSVGLWTRVRGGYKFHDWDKYSPSKGQVLERRSRENTRKAEWRKQANEERRRSSGSSSRGDRRGTDNGMDAGTDAGVPAPAGSGRGSTSSSGRSVNGVTTHAHAREPSLPVSQHPNNSTSNGHVSLPPSTGSKRAAVTFAWADEQERDHPEEIA